MRRIKILFSVLAFLSAVLAFILDRSKPSVISTTEIAATVSQNIQHEVMLADQEASLVLRGTEKENWQELSFAFYRIRDDEVVQWNQNEFLPDLQWFDADFSVKLLQFPAGDFLIKKWTITQTEYLVVVIPLHVTYKITNRYLAPGWNQHIFTTSDITISESNAPEAEPVYIAPEVPVFYISLLTPQSNIYSSHHGYVLGLTCLTVIFLVILIICWCLEFHKQRKYGRTLFILTASLGCIRVVMLIAGFPQRFTNSPVFDPTFFASSSYNPSLGDLLLNAIVVAVVILYVFATYPKFAVTRYVLQRSEHERLGFGIFFLLAALFSFLFPFLFIETISNNSSIELDITQSLSFSLLRILAYISLLLGSISGFAGAHIFFRTGVALLGTRPRFLMAYGIALAIFCAYFLSAERNYWITVCVATAYFILLFLTALYKYASRITFLSSFYFFLIILAFGIQASFSLKHFEEAGQLRSQSHFGSNFLIDRDILGEYLLHESANRIAGDPLIQSRMANPFLGRSIIYDKIMQVFLNPYFDRYDVKIYLYGSGGQPLGNGPAGDFASYVNALQRAATRTEYDGLYFIKDTDLQATKHYVAVVPISYHNLTGGFVVLDLLLNRIIPENVYPELLLDNRFSQYSESKSFSYAFLTQQEILASFGDFNYEKEFPTSLLRDSALYTDGIRQGGFNHIGIVDDSGRTAVVSAPAYSYFFLLTNVAFFFVLGLLLLFILLSCYGMVALFKRGQLNYSARIQLYIHLAFLSPLIVVSITTLSLTSRSAQEQLSKEFSDKSKLLADRIGVSFDRLQHDSLGQRSQVENQLTELSRLMNVDATLYDIKGNLVASTQSLIFENQLIARLINRTAWQSIVQDKQRSYIGTEHIGLLKYSASYVAVKSPESGKLMGIICLPFFDSVSSLERNQTLVFANMIDIFFVVFILFSILSFFAADELTFPLRFITKTLRSTTLIGENKPLHWKAKDEIGLMVNEYNRMVQNLEASKFELARSQKESAWREIAKQVAHEINNPLTPMKLTLQQMDRNLIQGNLTSEKTSQSIKTLLEQVDILNEIAASFSAFARMPAPLLQRVELASILRKVVELHAGEKSGKIELTIEKESLPVLGDAQLLNRIFSNIILNALQSGRSEVPVQVNVVATTEGDNCVVRFRDNGIGISKALREKIFLPHFTTKKTGSGIGLAIARQGIEQSGGEIWFESTEGAGTTFYIKLPLVSEASGLS